MAEEIEMIGDIGKRNKRAVNGGIVTNLDVDLTDAERAHIEWEIEATDHLAQTIASASKQSKGYTGVIRSDDPTRNTVRVTKHHRDVTPADVRAKRNSGEPVIPIAYDSARNVWVLDGIDKAAGEMGYLCAICLAWQDDITTRDCDVCDLKVKGYNG